MKRTSKLVRTSLALAGGSCSFLLTLSCANDGASVDTSNEVEVEPEADVAGEPTAAEPEPMTEQPEPVAVQPEPVAVQPEPVAGQPGPVAGQPEPLAGPEPVQEPTPVAAPEPLADAAPPEPTNSPDGGGEPIPGPLDGVCGLRGEGTVDTESFEGFEERYIIGDEGFGVDVCVVRFEVQRVGDAPAGCIDLAGDPCLWTHEVEYSNGVVLTDDGGACSSSELALDEASIGALEGSRVSYGFVEEYVGHNSVVLMYDEGSDSWVPNGNANWDDETGSFRFDRRDGICSYQGLAE